MAPVCCKNLKGYPAEATVSLRLVNEDGRLRYRFAARPIQQRVPVARREAHVPKALPGRRVARNRSHSDVLICSLNGSCPHYRSVLGNPIR
jgi:hypothetical protein